MALIPTDTYVKISKVVVLIYDGHKFHKFLLIISYFYRKKVSVNLLLQQELTVDASLDKTFIHINN